MTERLEANSPPESIRDLDAGHWNPKEILGELDLVRPIPTVILLVSFVALSVPVLAAVFLPRLAAADLGLLAWLTALVPAFLLSYYRGWHGASLALALGMAVLVLTHSALLLAGT